MMKLVSQVILVATLASLSFATLYYETEELKIKCRNEHTQLSVYNILTKEAEKNDEFSEKFKDLAEKAHEKYLWYNKIRLSYMKKHMPDSNRCPVITVNLARDSYGPEKAAKIINRVRKGLAQRVIENVDGFMAKKKEQLTELRKEAEHLRQQQ